MKWNAQIISHTHWDREWYLNSKYTNEWLVPFFDKLLEMLEREPDYQFVLDGQMLMLDDYFEELKKLKQPVSVYKNKIRKFVQQGRLHIGPYYLQPDWQLLSEEALVKNLKVGLKKASEYGQAMSTGWLLDNFGQISQTSQIHAEVGLTGLYAWRGVEMDPFNVQSEFLWESPDGTQLPCVYLLNSYRNVMRLAEHSEIMQRRILDEVEKLKDFMTTNNVLLMNGYDQEMVPDDIQPYIRSGVLNAEEIQVMQSNPNQYLKSVLDLKPELVTLKGALYSGRFISVFPGVMSARMYLKLQNDASQKAIEKVAEPLGTIDWLLGGEYAEGIFEKSWELLLRNHPHDSICGVSIDDVHSDMEARSRDFHFLVDAEIDRSLEQLALRIDTSDLDEENFFVFNPGLYPRSKVISFGGESTLVKDIPALGYQVVTQQVCQETVKVDGNKITNNKIEVTVNEDGTVDIFHFETQKHYHRLGGIQDAGDAGDEYNYSYPDADQYFYSNRQIVDVKFLRVQEALVEVAINCDLQIPIGITEDRKARRQETSIMPIRTIVRVEADSAVVQFKTTIKNTVKDHIVRVLFPSRIQADYAYAGSPFDVVKRPIHIDDYDESMIPENVRKVIVGAREAKPNTIFLGRELVDINDGQAGLAVLSKGLPEYTVFEQDNTIALTLFRSVGWVANEINTRIGDAGPEIFTPEAQCLREMNFEYAVYPHQGHYDEGGVLAEADRFNNAVKVFVTNRHSGSLPLAKSFFSIQDSQNSVRVTSIKRADDRKGVVIRLYNGGTNPTRVNLTSSLKINTAVRVNFLEEEKTQVLIEENQFEMTVASKSIETIYLNVERESLPPENTGYGYLVEDCEPYGLSQYPSQPLVTVEDVAKEAARAQSLAEGLDSPLTRRTALEAQLSAILTQDRYNETQVHALGYQLNEARVKRRVYDYIKDIQK